METNPVGGAVSWPWAERDQVIASVSKQLARIRPPTPVVTGPLGSGKSHVLDTVTAAVGHRFASVKRIRGRSTKQRFGALLSHLPLDATPAATEWQLAHQLRQTLVPPDQELTTLLVVDDLHLVDAESLDVIIALVEADGCVLFAGSESATSARDLPRVTVTALAPLTLHQASIVIADLAGPTDTLTERALLAASAGNPLVLRELLARATTHESFTVVDGLWSADGAVLQPRSVELTLRERRQRLAPEADQLLSLLAFTEVLPTDCLPRAALHELRQQGWVEADSTSLHLSPQIVAATGDESELALARLALDLAGPTGSVRVPASDWVRWKQLCAQQITDEELLAAARDAAQKWALTDALKFAEAAATADQQVVLLCAELHARQGDLDAAAQLHDRAVEMAEDDEQRVTALRAMADFRFFRRQRPDLALHAVSDVAGSIENPSAAVALEASIVMYAEMADNRTLSSESRDRVAAIGLDAAPLARADFGANASFFDVMRGNLEVSAVWSDAVEAVALLESTSASPPARSQSLGLRLALTEQLRRMAIGDLARARQQTVEQFERLAGNGPGLGIWLVVLADCDRWLGDLESATRHLVSARRYLATDDELGIGEIAQADLAGVLAEAGATDRAAEVFGEIGSDPSIFDPRSMGRMARTEVRLAVPDQRDAKAVELALLTRDFGFVSWSAEVLYEAIRCGHAPASTELLRSLNAHLASDFAAEMLAFGDALSGEDVAGLCSVAGRLFDRHAANFAADAVAHAALFAGARSNLVPAPLLVRARECSQSTVRTQELLGRAGIALTDLTDREREIAVLAARGTSSKDIAAMLDISIRTVDNHLGAIYRKLKVKSRSGLAEAFPS